MDINFLWLAFFVLVAYTTQAMTGFGSVIIAVTLGSNLYPIEFLLPIMVPLDILLNTYIVGRYRKTVDRTILFQRVLPLMAVGLLAGIAIFQFVQGPPLKKLFGLLITLLCARELYKLMRKRGEGQALSRARYSITLLAAGVVQGVFASGGPLVVYAVSRFNLQKAVFRSTLSGLWLVTNVTLTISYILTGRFTMESLRFIGLLIPLILVGMALGERFHHRVNEHRFRVIVYVILIVAGLSVVVS